MFPLLQPSKRGRASCIVFGIVVACVVAFWVILATMPPPTGGGEFRGINNIGRAFAGMGLLMAGWGLSVFGCALGFSGMMQKGATGEATLGLIANFLAAGALSLWFLSN